jgi:hypothetical protein
LIGHVSQGHDGGAALAVVDKRHFADDAIGAQSFEATVPAPDLDLSTHDIKELVALFALLEDRVSGSESPRRNLGPQMKIETNFIAKSTAGVDVKQTSRGRPRQRNCEGDPIDREEGPSHAVVARHASTIHAMLTRRC